MTFGTETHIMFTNGIRRNMREKRAKIRAEYCQKFFYERLLRVWRGKIEDKNQKFIIYKAYTHLKNYPLELRTVADLRQIHGIGDTLATRCHSAWEAACAIHSALDLKTIKNLSDEELISFMDNGKRLRGTTMSSGSSGSQSKHTNFAKASTENPAQFHNPKIYDVACDADDGAIQSASGSTSGPAATLPSEDFPMQNICYVACDPCDQAEVLLIADAREDHGSMRGNTVVECLTSYSYRMEGRTLSVGDYLWVLRKVDGTEVVLDWVVERKTWQDLQQSIRMGRYEEQKQRLCRSPMKNRVYLVEGRFTPEYYACEQALATTMVTHGFMIQRTKSPEETAQFLCRITDHLKTMTATRQITGISYESLQELSKKANADTVKDMWIKQLMVCPGMSSHRAQQVAYRFPSMSSIIEQYSQAEDSLTDSLLSSTVPGVNRRLSVQMRKFFSVLHSTFPVEHHRLN